MNFYHDLITQRSWQVLTFLKKKYQFILIGGWAVFLYTRALKSKDIDLVVEYEVLARLKEEFAVSKNEHLRKYEARQEAVEIDIYLPFYSNPGIPAEDLKAFSFSLEGFKVVEKEVLAILKQKALIERRDSLKGRKDLADLISLFRLADFDWQKYKKVIERYSLGKAQRQVYKIIKELRKLEELNLNPHQIARLKSKILPFIG